MKKLIIVLWIWGFATCCSSNDATTPSNRALLVNKWWCENLIAGQSSYYFNSSGVFQQKVATLGTTIYVGKWKLTNEKNIEVYELEQGSPIRPFTLIINKINDTEMNATKGLNKVDYKVCQ
jgi:hypothetical protein